MTEWVCDFITGCISERTWYCLCNAAAGGMNGMWGVELETNNITGCPAIVGVVIPSWKRFQLIRGEYGLTIYGEDDQTVSDVVISFFNMLNFTNEQIIVGDVS